jgi:hypothetical protein
MAIGMRGCFLRLLELAHDLQDRTGDHLARRRRAKHRGCVSDSVSESTAANHQIA